MRLAIEIVIIYLLILSLGTFTSALSIKLRSNPLGIDYDPAPPPELGPPLSAGALRDPAYLPAEIGGIVGAYVFIVSLVGVALLTVGRRLRFATERSKQALDVEMIQAPHLVQSEYYYPSPLSPTSAASNSRNFSWPSPEKTDRNPYVFPSANSPQSPRVDPAVDIRVVEADRQNLHRGLEDLYAHVMAHEEAKAASRAASTTSLPQPPLSPRLPQMPRQPLPSTSPQRPTKTAEKPRPSGINVDQARSQKTQSRTSSLMSSLSRKKGGVRNLQISSPIPTPLSQTFSLGYASDEEPLSPVHYKPPPPPPIPKDQVPYTHSRNVSSNTNDNPSPTSSIQSIDEQLAMQTPTQHSYKSSQASVPPPVSNPLAANPSKKSLTINTKPTMPNQSNPPSSNNSTRTLPFRAYDPPAGLSSPTFAQSTKTTVLERKAPALLSPGLKTPWTAGTVPYSPYQPQTPCTPYTPTLVTRQERKARKKLEGRAPVLEMIKSEEELWDAGL